MALFVLDVKPSVLAVCGLVIGFLVSLYRSRIQIRPDPIPKIPYNIPSASRFLGDLPDVKDVVYRRRWTWSQPKRHNSPLAQLFIHPFEKPTVVVSDYREVVDICTRRLKDFDRGTRNKECIGLAAPNFHMTIESRDPQYRQHKELLKDLMSPAFLNETSAPRIYQRATSLIELWGLKMDMGNGQPFAVGRDLHFATLDIICSVAFGLDESKEVLRREICHLRSVGPTFTGENKRPIQFPSAPADREIDALLNLADMVAVAQSSPFPALSQHLAMLNPRYAKAWWHRRRLVHRQTMKSVRKLEEGRGITPECALDQLLWREMNAAKKADRKPDYNSPVIRDELLGYLLGGHDSTATTMSWWVKYMSRHQDIQNRLRSELRLAHATAFDERRSPTVQDITTASIPYLDAVIEETTRYAAVVGMIVRTALHDTEILGYPIPKGVNVILALTGPSLTEPPLPVPESDRTPACQKDKDRVPEWGDNIDKYIPERWLKWREGSDGVSTQVFSPNAGPNLAFSTGPRQCFGKRLAILQMKVLMTLIIWNFEFEELDESLNSDAITEKLVNLPKDLNVKLKRL